ncbi:helix-turn-helix domain-containing protein [Desmospora activa]|uniref:DNA-binding NarL/FixJ family response regulator n=1 Tax=Desmospora activa DSM 45169 TaxID=1121389 RepID=A0A2T4ZAF3_9BACL|nr:LuxR C-terminal-related transcriptional regulator [Desmospora activa]PTM58845.1 DNA-binding NarL/FixJ family response regulator [Desmospora activa DSM 45169]
MNHHTLLVSSLMYKRLSKDVFDSIPSIEKVKWFKDFDELKKLLGIHGNRVLIILDGSDFKLLNSMNQIIWKHPLPRPKLIFLLNRFDKNFFKFLHLEGCGMILHKNINQLKTAISVVSNNGWYFCSDLKYKFFQVIDKNKEDTELSLTNMELRVIQELLKDKTNQQIADSLYIGRRTVEYHITSAIQKLGVNSRVGLAIKMADYFRHTYYTDRLSGQ